MAHKLCFLDMQKKDNNQYQQRQPQQQYMPAQQNNQFQQRQNYHYA